MARGDGIDPIEELNRRALDYLAEMALRAERRELPPSAAIERLDGLWGAVAGIVPKPTMDLIEETREALGALPGHPKSRFFVKDGQVLKIVYGDRSPSLVVMKVPGEHIVKSFNPDDELEPWRMREETAEKVAAKLVEQGYEEV